MTNSTLLTWSVWSFVRLLMIDKSSRSQIITQPSWDAEAIYLLQWLIWMSTIISVCPCNEAYNIMVSLFHTLIILYEERKNALISIDVYRIEDSHLPIISAGYDDPVLKIKLAIVYRNCSSLSEVGMSEYGFHSFKLLAVTIEQFVANLTQFRSSDLILLSNNLIWKSRIIFEITNLWQTRGSRANSTQIWAKDKKWKKE